MNQRQLDVFSYILGVTVFSGVREMFRTNPVYTNEVSSNEVLTMYAKMFGDMIIAKLKLQSQEEIEQIYKGHMQFIKAFA